MEEAKRLLKEKKKEAALEANERVKNTLSFIKSEMETVKMPIIDVFKDTLIK